MKPRAPHTHTQICIASRVSQLNVHVFVENLKKLRLVQIFYFAEPDR